MRLGILPPAHALAVVSLVRDQRDAADRAAPTADTWARRLALGAVERIGAAALIASLEPVEQALASRRLSEVARRLVDERSTVRPGVAL